MTEERESLSSDSATPMFERDQREHRRAVTRREILAASAGLGVLLVRSGSVLAATDDAAPNVEAQPYFAQLERLIKAMQAAGEPLLPEHEQQLLALAQSPTAAGVIDAERILARYTLIRVQLDDAGVGTASQGQAPAELVEQGWRCFLVRIGNPSFLQQALRVSSPAAIVEGSLSNRSSMSTDIYRLILNRLAEPADVAFKWLGYQLFTKSPLSPLLSGLGVEYRLLQLYSRDRGKRSAYIEINGADAPQGRLIAAERKNGVLMEFVCTPSIDVVLDVKDWDGIGTVASFVIRDPAGRIYPAPAHRLEPDFDFQPQVYRAQGETVRLPVGRYDVDVWRGPEYIRQRHSLSISAAAAEPKLEVLLERWINAAALGWYPGDTHIHAAGCSHYEIPTTGVTPETMIRHVRGEALAVGDVLTWSPGFYYQKQFFTGHVYEPSNALGYPQYQAANNTSLQPQATPRDVESLVRYDIEVSGFPSSHSGHLVLLRLKQQNYAGVKRLDEWPSWNLPILKWARAQGAVVGFAHCGAGMAVKAAALPNYEIPAFDYVGANEFVVDVVHGAVDFVSGAELHPETELNFWYHSLNCGFRVPMVGETDFPCFSDERPGTGRTYVGLDRAPIGDAGFSEWVEGIKRGRVYFGDGRSHFIGYRINGCEVGRKDVELQRAGKVRIEAQIAARLHETPVSADDDHLTPDYAYWHLERARIGKTRNVPLEVVVNGEVVLTKEILADGKPHNLSLEIDIAQSSWVALRILPSGHTAPTFVMVAGRPVRASRRSAQWSLDCIDVMWKEKGHRIRPEERAEALAAYDEARRAYRRIKSECLQD